MSTGALVDQLSRLTAVEHDASDADPGDASRRPRGERVASRGRETLRICAWCEGLIPEKARRDAVCCSVRCRQARHRFNRDAGRATAVAVGRVLRLAYADPPYPGHAWLYRDHPDFAGEVDHAALIRRLADEYDGWALSTSAAALPAVLALCPPGVRVAAWHRGERPTASRWPLSAWEPVIYCGGRPADPSRATGAARRVDSLVCGVSPLTTLPTRVTGTKPAAFCRWVFELLGAAPGDTLDDLFPGSGVVGRAWAAYARAERDASAVAMDDACGSPGEHDASPDAARYASAEVLDDASRPTSGATAGETTDDDLVTGARALPDHGGHRGAVPRQPVDRPQVGRSRPLAPQGQPAEAVLRGRRPAVLRPTARRADQAPPGEPVRH